MPVAQPAGKKAKAQAVQAAVTPAVEQHPAALSKKAARKLKAATVARNQKHAETAEGSNDQEEQQIAQPPEQSVGEERQGLADQLTRASNGAVELVPVEKSGFRNKEKVLLLTSRGIPPRFVLAAFLA